MDSTRKVPVFTQAPRPVQVQPGESIRLLCAVEDGSDDLEITWYKDSRQLRSKHSDPRISIDWNVTTGESKLTVEDARERDSGKYAVRAENSYGSVARMAVVLVATKIQTQAPTVVRFPTSQVVKPGETIQLWCEIEGSPLPDVQWFKDGEPIREKIPGDRVKMDMDGLKNMYTVTVEDAQPEDSGEFTVTAINEHGKIFHAVTVFVEEKDKGTPQFEEIPPEFTEKPKPVTVPEFEPVKVTATIVGEPEPTVTWFKGGKLLRSDQAVQITAKDGVHCMYIPRSTLLDTGEYTIAANNVAGGTFCTVTVHVEAATESEFTSASDQEYSMGTSTDADLVIIEKLSPQIMAEMEKLRSGDEDAMLFKEYVVREDYVDPLRGVTLNQGEVVEVLDTEKGEEWLIRKQADRKKICYIPVKMLQGKGEAEISQLLQVKETLQQTLRPDSLAAPEAQDMPFQKSPSPSRRGKLSRSPSKRSTEGELSSEDEAADQLSEVIAVYVAIADYKPPDSVKDSLTLTEGQFVDVLDSNNPNRWLVRTKPSKLNPSKQGWVPPGYLDQKKGLGQLDRRSTREVFREDIIQITNKEQEALVKRRYALTDLLETEREYLIDLKHVIDRYVGQFQREDLPAPLQGQHHLIFSTFQDIYDFHNEHFLSALMQCTGMPNNVGAAFLKFQDKFQLYVDFLMDRDEVNVLLDQPESKKFINWLRKQPLLKQGSADSDSGKQYEKEKGETLMTLTDYLERPLERINRYVQLLRDFIRYSSRAGEDCAQLEAAVQLLLDLPRQAADRLCVRNIEGFPGDVAQLGKLHRHDDFQLWDKDTAGRSRDRHAFLFNDKILLTKRKKPDNPKDPAKFMYRSSVELKDIQLNEILIEERQFEMWYAAPTSEKLTVQCRNAYARQAWCTDIRNNMRALGVEETDIPVEEVPKKVAPPVPPKPKKKVIETEKSEDGTRSTDESDTESRATLDYVTADSYESDMSSYFSAQEFEDGTTMPGFKRKLRAVIAQEGEPARMEVEVSGIPAPIVTWLRENKPITDTSGYQFETVRDTCFLIIKEAQPDMAGRFTVRIENKNGVRESSADLQVQKKEGAPPEFLQELVGLEVEAGKEAQLEVEVKGHPIPTVSWYKDELKITDGDQYVIQAESGRSALIIREVGPDSAGEYTARAISDFGTAETKAQLTVKECEEVGSPPAFTSELQPVSIKAGEAGQLEVGVEGTPTPNIQWLKDGEPITDTSVYQFLAGEGKSVLVLPAAAMEMSGTYTVKISNIHGVAETSTSVNVEEDGVAPEFTTKLESLSVNEGDSVQLEISVIGKPVPTVSWFKDGCQIMDTSVYKFISGDGKSALIMDKATKEMNGTYSVRISNNFGAAEVSASLTVKEGGTAPIFNNKLEPISATEGDSVKLEISASGEPAPSVTWYKDGCQITDTSVCKFLSGDGKSALVIDKLTLEMSGTYAVKIANDFGSAEMSAILTVNKGGTAPKFINKLEPVSAKEGEPIVIEILASGEPTPSITWYKDGHHIMDTSVYKFLHGDGKSALAIDSATQEMGGTYLVKIANDFGVAEMSTLVSVDRAGSPPEFTHKLEPLSATEGDSVQIEISASGEPAPSVTWYKDGHLITDTSMYKFISGDGKSALVIENAKPEMGGTYLVKIANDFGVAEMSTSLTVHKGGAAPVFNNKLEPVSATEGNSVQLEISASGEPAPSVTWYKDGHQITDTFVYKFISEDGMSALFIGKATLDMGGTYSVKMVNDFGVAEMSTSLTVNKAGTAPVFTNTLEPISATEGDSVQIEISASGEPAPSVTWYKDGCQITDTAMYKFLSGDGKSSLVIDKATPEMNGTYSVQIANDNGSAEQSTLLTVHKAGSAPEFTNKLGPISATEGDSVQIEISASGEPAPSVTWYKDGCQITDTAMYKFLSGDGKSALIIDKASLDMGGTYSVKIANDHGSAEMSTSLTVNKAGSAPTFFNKLEPISAKEGDSVQIEISVSGEPAPSVTWYKDGHQITDTSVYKFISGDGKSALVIDKATPDMNGTYSVKIANDLGSAEMSTVLTIEKVGIPPKLTGKLRPLVLREGEPLRLKISVSGEPTPTVVWLQNGHQITDTSLYKFMAGSGKCALLVDKVTLEMEGTYTVKAENEFGVAELSTKITVEKAGSAPKFASKMTPVELREGSSMELTVQLSGNPPPTVTWYKDGKQLDDVTLEGLPVRLTTAATTSIFTIDSATLEAHGLYCVQLTNEFGSAKEEFPISVEPAGEAPAFATPLRPVKLSEGEPFKLEVAVSGKPVPDISWFRDGKPIPDTSHYKLTAVGGKCALSVAKSTQDMSGEYSVKLKNQYGFVESTALVSIEKVGEAPSIKSKLKPVEVEEGGTIKLKVELGGDPPPAVVWFKDEKELDESFPCKITNKKGSSTLVIKEAALDMQGSYCVKVTNQLGSAEEKVPVTVVKVGEPPKFKSKLKPVEVTAGESCKLEVKVTGEPAPKVTWFKDGKPVGDTTNCQAKRKSSRCSLVIESADVDMTGTYSVKISNDHGSDVAKVKVTVKPAGRPPAFTSKMRPVTIKEGDACRLEVMISGEPAPTVTWFKDGKEVKENAVYSLETREQLTALTISKAKVDMSGTYTVKLTNESGSEEMDVEVAIEKAEKAPSILSTLKPLDVQEGEKVELQVDVSGEPSPVITWYKDGQDITDTAVYKFLAGDGKFSLIINKAKLNMSGEYKVKASNDLGSVECKCTLSVSEAEEPPEFISRLRTVTVKEGEQCRLEVKFSGKPAPTATWFKDGNQMQEASHYQFQTSSDRCSLVISKAELAMSGIYTVKLTNSAGSAECKAKLTVDEVFMKPEVLEELHALTVEEGSTVKLQCRISGKPVPEIAWYKDGSQLSENSRIKFQADGEDLHCFILSCTTTSDTGSYKVKAKNTQGFVTSKANLTVTELPKRKEEKDELNKKKKGKVREDIGVDEKLTKDNKEKEKPVILKDNTATLVEEKDEVRKVKAVDIIKEAEKEKREELDSLDTEDKVQDVDTLTCTEKLDKRADDIKNNAPGLTGYEVKLLDTEEADLSSYDLSKKAGAFDKDSIKKKSQPTLSIKQELQAQTVNEGDKAIFSCIVNSDNDIEVTWLIDGHHINHRRVHKAEVKGHTCTLTLPDVYEGDSGRYTCRILSQGEMVESSAKLSVQPEEVPASEPVISNHFSDVDGIRLGEAKFYCTIAGEPTKVQWLLNNRPLVETRRISITSKAAMHTLTIRNLLESDSGTITIKASNQGGEVSHSAKLKVAEQVIKYEPEDPGWAPKITRRLANIDAEQGDTVKLSVRAIGEPTPQAAWSKDGEPLSSSGRLYMESRNNQFSLTIRSAEADDSGLYQCELSNTAGKDSSKAKLTVTVPEVKSWHKKKVTEPSSSRKSRLPPTLPMDKPSVLEETDDSFVLSWQPATMASGGDQTGIRYKVERRDLPSGVWRVIKSDISSTSYGVTGYITEKDYLYRVLAENDYGTSEPTAAVAVYAKSVPKKEIKKEEEDDPDRFKSRLPPRSPYEKPSISHVSDGSLLLSWAAAETPSYAVQTDVYYTVERRCPPDRNWVECATDLRDTQLLVKDYHPDKEYMFRVRAANKFGRGDYSLAVTVLPKPVPPPDLPLESSRRRERERRMEDLEEEYRRKQREREEQKPKVVPRSIWDRPDVLNVTEDSFRLKWRASSIPSYARQTPITYTIEKREPPGLTWTEFVAGLTDTYHEVKKFKRVKDTYFRLKAVNEFGESEPSMPCLVQKLEDTDEFTRSRKGRSSREDSVRDLRIPKHTGIFPEFTSLLDPTVYGVEGQPLRIVTHIKGYPQPKVYWYLRGEKLDLAHGHHTCTVSPSGELALEIDSFRLWDCGEYQVYLENEMGAVTQTVQVAAADPPTFLEPLKDQVIHLHKDGRLECRVHGIPYPEVRFKHDWRSVASSHRVKICQESHDHWSLNIRGAIRLDEGMYECVLENVAGKIHCTAKVKVAEKPDYKREIKFNPVSVEDHFHVIDEIGRGSYGVVRRVIDKNFGSQFAAKFLRFGEDETRRELQGELEALSQLSHPNIVQAEDGYEDRRRLIIVMEMLTGGELLQRLVREDTLTESEVAFFVRQLLRALEHAHSRHVMHLDVKPENLLLSEQWSDEIKLIDFGYARRYTPSSEVKVKYGTPEFVAPEVVLEEPVTPAADMWATGVVTHLLLSGISPFYADTERETLKNVRQGSWQLDEEAFRAISDEGKDFIKHLLIKDPKKRMSASEALDHDFIKLADHRGLGQKLSTEALRAYCARRRWQRGISSVKTVVRPRPLSSYMVDQEEAAADLPDQDGPPPAELLQKKASTESGATGMIEVMGPPSAASMTSTIGSASSSEWAREYEDEDTWYEWTSAYQTTGDSYLGGSRDPESPSWVSRYRSPSKARGGRLSREKRDVRDMDKEDDEVRTRSPKTSRRSLRQLKSYVASAGREEGVHKLGFPPIFTQKMRDQAYNVGEHCTLRVHVVGRPPPSVSWYRNDELLTDGLQGYGRVRTSMTSEGRCSLTILSTMPNDFGIFKCVARNKYGKVTCRARMLLGSVPTRPGRPHVTRVSDTEAFVIWEEPESDGNSYISAYRVDWLKHGEERWTLGVYTIDECALVKGLQPGWIYRFRVSAINKFGISPYSWASVEIRTKNKGCPPIDIDQTTKTILLRSRQATRQPSPERSPTSSRRSSLDETVDEFLCQKESDKAVALLQQEVVLKVNTDPSMFWELGNEIWRGRFSIVRDAKSKETNKQRVAKIFPYRSENMEESLREYEMLKGVRQEHVVRMLEALVYQGHVILVFEKLYGENVARSLSLKNKYNENHVSCIIKQVLDALQFLHHRGVVHLNIQPDNVIMVSRRRFDVKLIDFGRAHRVTTSDGVKVPREGTAEFMAPEKVVGEDVGVAADIWGVGVLLFILLSGSSPFRGETEEDTFSRVSAVQYDAYELYHNISRHAMKFIYQTLRRDPRSRLTIEECLDHRWITPNHQLVKTRKNTVFATERLRKFEEAYISRRMSGVTTSAELIDAYGSPSVFEDEDDTY